MRWVQSRKRTMDREMGQWREREGEWERDRDELSHTALPLITTDMGKAVPHLHEKPWQQEVPLIAASIEHDTSKLTMASRLLNHNWNGGSNIGLATVTHARHNQISISKRVCVHVCVYVCVCVKKTVRQWCKMRPNVKITQSIYSLILCHFVADLCSIHPRTDSVPFSHSASSLQPSHQNTFSELLFASSSLLLKQPPLLPLVQLHILGMLALGANLNVKTEYCEVSRLSHFTRRQVLSNIQYMSYNHWKKQPI